jgi:CheY-like chemotaxis protein
MDLRNSEEQLRQSQKMEAVGRLAGGVAHDFNNLLLVITGCVDVARRSVTEHERVLDLLGQIESAAQRAAGLTRQLLAFSRQQVLEPRVVDVNGLVADTVALLRRLIGEDIALETSLDPRAYPVLLDPGQVAQVLMNLAVNARDAMPSGGKLTIATSNVELDASASPLGVTPGLYARIVVSDTGHGMDETTQARAFEPFFTTKEHGTGLGLSTVYGIVKQSGGALAVRSEVGHGTTIEVYFPRATEAARRDSSRPRLAVGRGHETVLLVEDEASVRKVVRLLLTANGYTVLSATGPDEALDLAEKHAGEIDVVLTDVVMPGMNGSQLAERVAKLSPEAKVVFMSGYASGALPSGVLDGDVAFLQKPFTEGALIAKLRSVLGRQNQTSQR